MKVREIPNLYEALRRIPKKLEKKTEEIRGRIKILQTTALLRSTRILRRVLESWEDLLSVDFRENHHLQQV